MAGVRRGAVAGMEGSSAADGDRRAEVVGDVWDTLADDETGGLACL